MFFSFIFENLMNGIFSELAISQKKGKKKLAFLKTFCIFVSQLSCFYF